MELMIDSGAVTAASTGQIILVEEYARFLKDHAAFAKYKINLDVVPVKGKFTAQDFERAAALSAQNFDFLSNLGIKGIMPVYHWGDDKRWLDRMLEDDCLVGIGNSRSRSAGAKFALYRQLYQLAQSKRDNPRLHLLGEMGKALKQIPWYSADSTTPSIRAAYGCVPIFLTEGDYAPVTQIDLRIFKRHAGGWFQEQQFYSIEEYPQPIQDEFNRAFAVASEIYRQLYPSRPLDLRGEFSLRLLTGMCSMSTAATTVYNKYRMKLFHGIGQPSSDRIDLIEAAQAPYVLVSYAAVSQTRPGMRNFRRLEKLCGEGSAK